VVRSANRLISRLGVLVVCGPLLVGTFAGCSTTQEKAARQQAQSKRILEAREQRQKQEKSKSHDHGGRKR
jgi:hypothetical protein